MIAAALVSRLLLAGFGASFLLVPTSASEAPAPAPFSFNWSGSPAAPQPWHPADWDVIVHSRDTSTWDQLDPMEAQHGADCSPPPATHPITTYDDAVYICRGHMMTAINAGGYGVIYFAPNQMVDFGSGTASIKYSVSTLRSSPRDWQDIWITPFDDNLVLPLYRFPDLQGPPRNAVHFQLVSDDTFNGNVFRNFVNTDLPKSSGTPYDQVLKQSATQRGGFELDISRTHLRFGMPGYNLWWIDTDVPDLGFSQAVVQLGHHSYNPTKAPNGLPGTWHWSNFSISSAVAFTMLRGDLQSINADGRSEVCFSAAAPAGSHLRFAGVGSIDVSFDHGRTFAPARMAAQIGPHGDGNLEPQLFASYWTPIPEGTSSVVLRGTDWWGGPWWVRDPAIWSQSVAPAGLAAACPRPTAGRRPSTAAVVAAPPPDGGPWLTRAVGWLHALDHNLDHRLGTRNLQLIEAGLVVLIVLVAGGLGFALGRRRKSAKVP